MIETKQKQIGPRGYTYHVTQFGAKQGGRVLVRLLKMVGGAAGDAMGGVKDFDLSVIGKMVGNLAETVSEEDYDFLCDTFTPLSSVSGGEYQAASGMPLSSEGVFDLHFAGAYQELGQWLLFCIEVNYGGFLGEGGIVQRVKTEAIAHQVSVANKVGESQSMSPSISEMVGVSGK